MKTAEEIYRQVHAKHGLSGGNADKYDIEAMELYAEQFKPKLIIVSDVMPPFDTLILLRGVISWKSKNSISYFSDIVRNDYEILEYGMSGYLLENNSDYLVVNHPNPEELCSEYITHWMPLPSCPA